MNECVACDNDQLSLREIQLCELDILSALLHYCSERNLRCSLIGGSLLGAVRHRGFIPWDDDIDICMPRPDYERLINLADDFNKNTGYLLEGVAGSPIKEAPICKATDPHIKVQSDFNVNIANIWVDVLPIDGMPEDETDLRKLLSRATRLRSLYMWADVNPNTGSNTIKRVGKAAVRVIDSIPIVRRHWLLALNKTAKSIPYGSTSYCGAVSWGMYGPGERLVLDEFMSFVDLEFEGIKAPAMSCWESYLNGVYGDYMQLPPESKRVPHIKRAWHISE